MKKLLYLILPALIISCSSNQTGEDSAAANTPEKIKGQVILTQEQIAVSEIETEKLSKQNISETIKCTGTTEIPPENIATVSPAISGFVKDLNFLAGEFVRKGDILATLQHPDFIKLQQQYLEAKSQVEYFQAEYKRQGELTVENAASIKKMQKAKADYLTSKAIYESLKSQLELLGIHTDRVEKGDFENEFRLIAPISGVVSALNANKGKLVSPDVFVYEIVNDEMLYLKFKVFERDIPRVKVGQKIVFWPLNDNYKFEAKVQRVGIMVHDTDRSTKVHSKIDNKNKALKAGMYLNASIYISERESYTIPSEAIVNYMGDDYVFVKNNETFNLKKINKGIEQNNFTEIINPDESILKSEIVTSGNYYLISKLETDE